MVMNFWEAQRRAKSRTTLYVCLFIALTLVVAAGMEMAMRYFAQDSYDPDVPLVGPAFMAFTFLVAGFQYLSFKSGGGSYVAESLGARRVSPTTSNFQEKQLLNIVEEMALAASLPIPPVYILEAQEINAFAAGLTSNNAAITVTRGALLKLNRDELQGVIGHEFGHVYNGDMKISMRLAAMIMGFYFMLYLGLRILQFSPRSRDDGKKGGNPILIAALIFIVGGVITWFFGSILKASISREREYLADASAVQFTRKTEGIASALRKLAEKPQAHDMPSHGLAYSHLYFDDETFLSGLFSTHPPLEKRIAALEGREYIPEEWNIKT